MKRKFKYVMLLSLGLLLVGCNETISQNTSLSDTTKDTTSKQTTSEESTTSKGESTSGTETTTSEETTSETPSTSETSSSVEPVGDYYNGYYRDLVSWTDGEDLLTQLSNIMHKDFVGIGYTGNWSTMQKACQSLTNFNNVDLVYSESEQLKTETVAAIQTGWNREHAFPASLMTGLNTSEATKTIGIATDFHNLWAASGSSNSSRGNKNFGIASGDGVQTSGDAKFTSSIFEPNDNDKGKLARSIFYIATMYAESDGIFLQEEVNDSTAIRAIGNLSTLINWSDNFSVSRFEYQHNLSVYTEQFNRNCFVDYPELADYVFGSKSDQSGALKNLTPSAKTLDVTSTNHVNYAIKAAKTTYLVGETFDLSKGETLALCDVKGNYSTTDVALSEATISGLNDGYVFTNADISSGKSITITIKGETLKYNINVKDSSIENASYSHDFVKSDLDGASAGKIVETTLNSIVFNEYMEAGTYFGTDTAKGVQIGSGSAPAKTFYLESKEAFTYDNKTSITAIYFKGNVASKTTATLKIYVDSSVISTETITYDSTGSNIVYGKKLDTPLTGKVKFEITNLTKALYVKNIGIDLA